MNKNILISLLISFGLMIGAAGVVTVIDSTGSQGDYHAHMSNSFDKGQNKKSELATEKKRETVEISLAFSTQYYDDPHLENGVTRVDQEGVPGKKIVEYEVTYVDGRETGRRKLSETIISEPVDKVVANGTYIRPQVQQAQSCPSGSYVNTYGNTVCRPSTINAGGATAICRDGTYSYSQSRRGTCSRHGGVKAWL